MSERLPDEMLLDLSEYLTEHTGLYFPSRRWDDLQRGLEYTAQDLNMKSAADCARWIRTSNLSKTQVESLAAHLTVGETYFFREPRSWEVLEQSILPELIARRGAETKRLRIWSAACSSGEEPYTFAILLSRLIPDLADWNVTILATDINPKALKKASEGVYGQWSFRETPDWIRERHFDRTGERDWTVRPEIKKLVDFTYLNLAKDPYPSLETNTNAMDIVLCRNVLMYFTAERARRVIEQLNLSLIEGGCLFVGPNEAPHSLSVDLTLADFPGVFVFRKSTGAPPLNGASAEPATVPIPERLFDLSSAAAEVASINAHRESREEGSFPETKPAAELSARAHKLYQLGLLETAEQMARRALEENGDEVVLVLLARICADQGRLDDALSWCERAIRADKLNPSNRYLNAVILDEIGDAASSIKSLHQALYLDSTHVLANYALATALRRSGNETASIVYFNNALTLLGRYKSDEAPPDSAGITAGRMAMMIRSAMPSNILQEPDSGGRDV